MVSGDPVKPVMDIINLSSGVIITNRQKHPPHSLDGHCGQDHPRTSPKQLLLFSSSRFVVNETPPELNLEKWSFLKLVPTDTPGSADYEY